MSIPSWVRELTDLNLVVLLDVALDLRDAGQLTHRPVLQAVPDVVRFPVLMPVDGSNMRDRYLQLRASALRFFREKNVVNALLPIRDPYAHRWRSRTQVDVDQDILLPVLTALQSEYDSRRQREREDAIAAHAGDGLSIVPTPMDKLRDLVFRLHGVVMELRIRHSGRATLDVNDEYDVQDVMRVLLATVFDDVRPEECSPSYGGSSSRTDFLLKSERIVLEVKKTRSGLSDRQVGEQLIIDTARYAAHPDCGTLMCVVYDPENRIVNPTALESDLSGQKNGVAVEVIVVPRRY